MNSRENKDNRNTKRDCRVDRTQSQVDQDKISFLEKSIMEIKRMLEPRRQ